MLKQKLNNIHYYLLVALMCFPLLHMKLSNLLIILFAVHSIFSAVVSRPILTEHRVKSFSILVAPFVLIVCSVLWHGYNKDAAFYIEKSLSLFVFPLSFFISPNVLTVKQRDRMLSFFALSTFMVVLWGLTQSAIRLHVYIEKRIVKSYAELTSHEAFSHYLRTYFEEETSFHPTYAGIFLAISILILFNRLVTSYVNISILKRLIYIFSSALGLGLLAILASRAPFLATILGLMIIFYFNLTQKKYFLVFLLALSLLTLLIFATVPSFSARFKEVSSENFELPDAETQNSFNIRTGIYKCSSAIVKQNWLLGVGPGNLQTQLNACYANISKEVYHVHDYNTHNQFVDFWASMGILAPILLLVLLVWLMWIGAKQHNWMLVSVFLLFLLVFLTENVLQRQYGVVVFALFSSLFGLTAFNEKDLFLGSSNK